MRHTIQHLTLLIIGLLLAVCALAACSPASAVPPVENLPTGDAARGAALYTESINGAPACSTCHTQDGSTSVGPSLLGIGSRAGTQVPDQSALMYVHDSIVRPAAHIVSGFPNSMYNQYGQRLAPQQLADLIAYLLTL